MVHDVHFAPFRGSRSANRLGGVVEALRSLVKRVSESAEILKVIGIASLALAAAYSVVFSFSTGETFSGYLMNLAAAVSGVLWLVVLSVGALVSLAIAYWVFDRTRATLGGSQEPPTYAPIRQWSVQRFRERHFPLVAAAISGAAVFGGIELMLQVVTSQLGVFERLMALMPGLLPIR